MKKVKVSLTEDFELTAEPVDSEDFGWDDIYLDVDDDSDEVYVVIAKCTDDVEHTVLAEAYDDENDAYEMASELKGSLSNLGVIEKAYVETVTIS
jgi:hypothetical protein